MFQPLKSLLKARIKKYELDQDLLVREVFDLWSKIIEKELGPSLLSEAQPFSFKQGVLSIKVTDRAFLSRIKSREAKVFKTINEALKRNFIGAPKLQKIHYQIDD